jgi:superfamily II DNA helicase RecQ
VISNKTLTAIAQVRPADLTALGMISGIGPAKLEKYGSAILAALRASDF